MYAIVVLRYRRPLEQVLPHIDAHRAYLQGLHEQGVVVASGPVDPRNGGVLLLRVEGADAAEALPALDRIRDGDPYIHAGVAQYEILPWTPVIGKEGLDAILPRASGGS